MVVVSSRILVVELVTSSVDWEAVLEVSPMVYSVRVVRRELASVVSLSAKRTKYKLIYDNHILNMSGISYQALLGETNIDADYISVETLSANKITTQDIGVTGVALVNELQIPSGAHEGWILTTDGFGIASWQPDPNVNLLGDATGLLTSNRVDTLAGGTIPVTTVVTLADTQTLTNKTLNTPIISTISNTGSLTLPTSTDTLVGRDTIDTLTNKTLTLPIISSISNSGTVTIPAGTSTLVNTTAVQTLLNKTLTLPTMGSINNGGTISIPSGVGTFATIAASQTFTNKTLTLPTIASINNGGTITIPSGAGTFATLAASQTLTNKTLTAPIISSIVNTGTLTLPTSTDTLVGKATTDTMTNKTITGTTNNVDANSMRNGSTWVIPYGGVAPATNNILTYNGTNAVWVAPAAPTQGNLTGDVTSVGLATTLTNAPVIAKVLTGLSPIIGTPAATDSILVFANKTTGNLNALTTVVGTPVSTATANAIAKRDASGGCAFAALNTSEMITSQKNIYMNNQLQNKMIALHDNGTTTDRTLLTFYGFGIASNTLRYQVSGTADSHVFYAATSGTVSNEVFRVFGTGHTRAAGNIQAGYSGIFSAPQGQGASVSWNRTGTGTSNRTAFICQQAAAQGAGINIGGFEWLNYDHLNVLTTPNPLMTLDSSGNLAVTGSITGGTDNAITLSGTWGGGVSPSVAKKIMFRRTNNTVTMSIEALYNFTGNGANSALYSIACPSWAVPSLTIWPNQNTPATAPYVHTCVVTAGTGVVMSYMQLEANSKNIIIFPIPFGGTVVSWNASATNSIYPTSFSWIAD
jgi:hypothetical protein